MTHYFKNKAGNKVIGIDADRVTEYDLLFTMGNETITSTVKLDVANVDKMFKRLSIEGSSVKPGGGAAGFVRTGGGEGGGRKVKDGGGGAGFLRKGVCDVKMIVAGTQGGER